MEVGGWLTLIRRAAVDRDYARDKLERAVGFARAVPVFRNCETGARVCALGFVRVQNEGRVVIGDRVTFAGGMFPTELVCRQGASIEIGDESLFNYGTSIDAAEAIRIGRRCMVASMVRICDASRGRRRPVTIGDDVWVAYGAIIEAGVSVGAGSVLAAGCVVSKDVPPGSLAIGNPARCLALEVVS